MQNETFKAGDVVKSTFDTDNTKWQVLAYCVSKEDKFEDMYLLKALNKTMFTICNCHSGRFGKNKFKFYDEPDGNEIMPDFDDTTDKYYIIDTFLKKVDV